MTATYRVSIFTLPSNHSLNQRKLDHRFGARVGVLQYGLVSAEDEVWLPTGSGFALDTLAGQCLSERVWTATEHELAPLVDLTHSYWEAVREPDPASIG